MSLVGSAGTVTFQFGATGTQVVLQAIKSVDAVSKTLDSTLKTLQGTLTSMPAGTMPQFFQQLGAGAEQASTKTQTFTERMSGFQGNLLTAATSVGTFTASIFGIDAAMDGLTQSELSLEQARVRQDRMTTTLHAQEQRLNEMRTSGNYTIAEIAVQEERVNTTRQQLEVQTERVAFQQQNLNEQTAQFGAQILPQVITATLSGVTAMNSIVTLIGKSEKATALLNKAWTAISSAFRTGAQGAEFATGAMTKAIPAASGLGTAISLLGTVLAGFAIGAAAVGIPLALWITNAFGARDSMYALGESIGKAVPPLEGFLSTMEFSARLWTNIITGMDLTMDSATRLGEAMDLAKQDVSAAIDEIMTKMDALKVNVADMAISADKSGKPLFDFLFGGEDAVQKIVAQTDILIGVIDNMGAVINKGGLTDIKPLEQTVTNVIQFGDGITAAFTKLGAEAPPLIEKIIEVISDMKIKIAAGLLTEGADPLKVYKDNINLALTQIADLIAKHGPELQESLTNLAKNAFDPIGFQIDALKAKIEGTTFTFHPIEMLPEIGANIDQLVAEILKGKEAFDITNATLIQMGELILPELQKQLQETNPEIDTFVEAIQSEYDRLKASNQIHTQYGEIITALAIKYGVVNQKSEEKVKQLTEEEKKLANLAKAYFDLDLQTSDDILARKAQIEWVDAAIEKYDDQIESLKELQIEYGSNEQAVYGVNDATMALIESKKQQIIQEQALTVAAIDVTKALDGSTESQILLNDAVIEGVKAAADFVTELVKGEKQTEAYGKALSANVMEVLKKMPQAIGEFADEFRNTLPNLFKSLDEFQGKIKPFDKQSIKDYKEELKDLDVPKSLRDLYISSAKVWQDKDEIIKEGEALFAGMAGSLVHNFEEIDVKDVTKFLDEIGGRLTEMEAQGVGTAFTGNIRTLIDHIKNSADPVQELLEHFDALKGAMDPAAIDVVSTSVKVFGTNVSDIISKSILGDLTKETNLFQQAVNKLGQEDLQKLATDVGAYMTGIRGQITGANPQTKFSEQELKDIEDMRQAEKAITIAQNKLKAQPSELTTAWQNAATAIDTATAQISLSVGTMADTVGTGILANVTSVAALGTIWQQTSTNIGTYAPAITEATNTMSTTSVTAFNNSSVALGAYDKAFGILKTDVDTNTKAMTTSTDTWSTGSITSFNNVSVALGAFDKAMKILQDTVKTGTDEMLTNIQKWDEGMVKAFKNVSTGADDAQSAVQSLIDTVAELKDKTVTIKMEVEKSGGSSGDSKQSGGIEVLTGTKLFTGGEGRKPEVHFFFPLDEMAQSHAKSEFTLPFSIGDIGLNNRSPATLVGKPSTNQPIIPSNLVSNLRLNANLHIDLGNEIKKIVREEINAIAVTRLDRMAF